MLSREDEKLLRKSLCVLMIGVGLSAFPSILTAEETKWWERGKSLLGGLFTEKQVQSLSTGEIADGLKEALRVGTENVVRQLGKADGFNADKAIHIPLPAQLAVVQSTLDKIGMGSALQDIEAKLNHAAEEATPQAKTLFWNAIREMSIDDVKRIFNGADDAATSYFKEKTNAPLKAAMQPIIDQKLSEIGVLQAYKSVMGRYQSIPFVPDVQADISNYTLDKCLDGIFHYLAIEEAAIRKDPLKRSTELLRRVFASQP